ncbi:MAG: tail protein X [Desulfurococcaceae archaeon]
MLTKYITQDGDRWDTISEKVYGDPYLYPLLLLFNPQYQDITIFPAGIELIVPIVEEETPEEEVAPPWQKD